MTKKFIGYTNKKFIELTNSNLHKSKLHLNPDSIIGILELESGCKIYTLINHEFNVNETKDEVFKKIDNSKMVF